MSAANPTLSFTLKLPPLPTPSIRDVVVSEGPTVKFRARGVQVPAPWSDTAASTLFRIWARRLPGCEGVQERWDDRTKSLMSVTGYESSVYGMVERVVYTIGAEGVKGGYFDEANRDLFCTELRSLFLNQYALLNTPAWINIGVTEKPQASACFIVGVGDSLASLRKWQDSETVIFNSGSGSGADLSAIRPEGSPINGGGAASGPVSFARGTDTWAGTIKSGGKCLAPYQKVYTEQGPVAVSELAKRPSFIVISFDPPSKRFKAKRAQAWQSGEKQVLRVKTDKGSFDLSADHPLRLSTGDFVKAGDLHIGMSLFSCAIDSGNGYVRVHLKNGKKEKDHLHRMIVRDVFKRDIDGLVVHHIDGNRFNNDPSNLRVLTQSEHATTHGQEAAQAGTCHFQHVAYPKNSEANPMHHTSAWWQSEDAELYLEKQGQILKASGRARDMQDAAARQKMLNTLYQLICAGCDVSTENKYIVARIEKIGRIPSIPKLQGQIRARFGSYEAFREEARKNNHQVTGIEAVGVMPVFDVEVECPTEDDHSPQSGHNFVIWSGDDRFGSGIVVSNSRRAAKMLTLSVHHPDVRQFIIAKRDAQRRAHTLIDAGFPGNWQSDTWQHEPFQNSNLSIRVTDEFMQAVIDDTTYQLVWDGRVVEEPRAREIWDLICECAWETGDPGLQYDTTINKWHTVPKAGRIVSSNPCQPGFATVLTPEGIRTFADIDVGSVIWSGKQWTTVTRKVATGVKPVQMYVTNCGHFIGTANHRVILKGERVEVQAASGIDTCPFPAYFSSAEPNTTWDTPKPRSDVGQRVCEHATFAFTTMDTSRTEAVTSIVPLGDHPVYDITVEADEHTYWTGGLLVSNCSEFLHHNDTACNLASLNLLKFRKPDGSFDTELFLHCVRLCIVAQEIICNFAGYPTPEIAENSRRFRPLGLGYCNLGALLMRSGMGYDSDEAREYAAAITALMGGQAYRVSAELATVVGPFEGFAENREEMLRVVGSHANEARKWAHKAIYPTAKERMFANVMELWNAAYELGNAHGFRNSQATLLAPTGTIGMVMDADTTGVEPEYDLVTYKTLASGGIARRVSGSVREALAKLGREESAVQRAVKAIEETGRIGGALDIDAKDRAVLATAAGEWPLAPEAHVRMMAAVQPFLSGGISKTVNLPKTATVEDVSAVYKLAWEQGVKCVALYRDGCKRSQPLNGGVQAKLTPAPVPTPTQPQRRSLPDDRATASAHKLSLGGHDLYMHVGYFDDGMPGELFVRMAKVGTTESCLLDALCQAVSVGLQYGVPLDKYLDKWIGTRFEPSGFTGADDIRSATSPLDLIAKKLRKLPERVEARSTALWRMDTAVEVRDVPGFAWRVTENHDLSPCCGATYKTTGSCKTCSACGATSGGCG